MTLYNELAIAKKMICRKRYNNLKRMKYRKI